MSELPTITPLNSRGGDLPELSSCLKDLNGWNGKQRDAKWIYCKVGWGASKPYGVRIDFPEVEERAVVKFNVKLLRPLIGRPVNDEKPDPAIDEEPELIIDPPPRPVEDFDLVIDRPKPVIDEKPEPVCDESPIKGYCNETEDDCILGIYRKGKLVKETTCDKIKKIKTKL